MKKLCYTLTAICAIVCFICFAASGLETETEIIVATLLAVAITIFCYIIIDNLFAIIAERSAERFTQKLNRSSAKHRELFWKNFTREARFVQPGRYLLDTHGHLTRID